MSRLTRAGQRDEEAGVVLPVASQWISEVNYFLAREVFSVTLLQHITENLWFMDTIYSSLDPRS